MSKIQWTEDTVNPVVGCSKISPGCQNCYAEGMAKRLVCMGQEKYFGVVDPRGWTGKTSFDISAMDKCIKKKKPTVYFVCSMGDLFHESVNFDWIWKVFYKMVMNSQHTFLLLTKRPDRMKEYYNYSDRKIKSHRFPDFGPIPNVWLGVTAENQEQADKRIPILLSIPAAKRFVSIEPMLEYVDISKYLRIVNENGFSDYGGPFSGRDKLDWVICGGESGPKARPIHPGWVRSLRDQCEGVGAPFFFKQWGEWHPNWHEMKRPDLDYNQKHTLLDDGIAMCRVGKKKAGRELDGKIWDQRPKI